MQKHINCQNYNKSQNALEDCSSSRYITNMSNLVLVSRGNLGMVFAEIGFQALTQNLHVARGNHAELRYDQGKGS